MRPEGYYKVTVAGSHRAAEFEIRLAGGRISGVTDTGARIDGSYFADTLSSRVRFSVHSAALALRGEFDPGRRGTFSYRDGERLYHVTVAFAAPLCHEVVAA